MMDFSPLNLRSKNLFKRCVTCNSLTSASCPVCKADEDCTLIPATCDRCAEYTCIATSESGVMPGLTATAPVHKVPVAPVIAGAVIGGVLFIATIVWLIWKFVLKGRRQDPIPDWDPAAFPMEKSGPTSFHTAQSTFSNDARSRTSTHTYRSMASTVLTRASNVIQIAFIPGVTARSSTEPSTTPRTLVPPVPPVPLPTSPLNQSMRNSQDLHFHPGQIRHSAFSTGTRDGASRTSEVPSVSPSVSASLARGSIASTMYGGDAVAVTPIKPSIVSVKSFASSPHTSTPPMPSPFNRSSSSESSPASGGKSMIVQMPVSREKGDLSSMPPSRVRSLRGLKPKAVMISSKHKNAANASSQQESSSSTLTSPPLPATSAALATLPEETTRQQPSSSTLAPRAALRPDSSASDVSHSRARTATTIDSDSDDSEAEEAESSNHTRSRQSLLVHKVSPDAAATSTTGAGAGASGPFSDEAAIPASPLSPTAPSMRSARSVQSARSDPDAITVVGRDGRSMRHSSLSPFGDAHEMK